MREHGADGGLNRRVPGWCKRHPGEELFTREGYLSFMRELSDLSASTLRAYSAKLRTAWVRAAEAGLVEPMPEGLPTWAHPRSARVPRETDLPIVMIQHYVVRLTHIFGEKGLASILGVSHGEIRRVLAGRGTLPVEALEGLERVFVVAMADDLDVSPTEIERLRRVVRGRQAARLSALAEARTGE